MSKPLLCRLGIHKIDKENFVKCIDAEATDMVGSIIPIMQSVNAADAYVTV